MLEEAEQFPPSTQLTALLIGFCPARPEQSAALNQCKQLRKAAQAFLQDTARAVRTPPVLMLSPHALKDN